MPMDCRSKYTTTDIDEGINDKDVILLILENLFERILMFVTMRLHNPKSWAAIDQEYMRAITATHQV